MPRRKLCAVMSVSNVLSAEPKSQPATVKAQQHCRGFGSTDDVLESVQILERGKQFRRAPHCQPWQPAVTVWQMSRIWENQNLTF